MKRTRQRSAQRDGRLRGKVALVTGASRGIGLAIARALAAKECTVIVTGRRAQSVEKAAREVRTRRPRGSPQGACTTGPGAARVLAKVCDIADTESVHSLFAAVQEECGRLDILVNNAGISHPMAPIEKLSPELWQQVIATNLTGMFLVTRAALPLMSEGGSIVNNLSIAARGVFAGEAAYCASKHGALGFTNTLREEVRSKGIRVIALMPGPTNTDLWNQFWPDAPREKMMSPETVAAAVVNALVLPAESAVEELTIMPTAGTL